MRACGERPPSSAAGAVLTPGEREVLERVLEGNSNRQIAEALNRCVRAIEVRRASLMKKMKAHNLPELVRFVIAAENGS